MSVQTHCRTVYIVMKRARVRFVERDLRSETTTQGSWERGLVTGTLQFRYWYLRSRCLLEILIWSSLRRRVFIYVGLHGIPAETCMSVAGYVTTHEAWVHTPSCTPSRLKGVVAEVWLIVVKEMQMYGSWIGGVALPVDILYREEKYKLQRNTLQYLLWMGLRVV